jgi:hypothetical protein
MKVLSSIIVVAVALGGYRMYTQHRADRALREAFAGADTNGFVDVPPPMDQDSDTVYVIAAQNCPRAAAQKAEQLARQLGAQGVSVQRSSRVAFRPDRGDRAAMDRVTAVMNGPLPLVFFHGRVASNPELNQVVEEYRRPGAGQVPR